MNYKRKAFTLIELLIVIAIIAILAAILMPVFASAREKARASACISNQKQIGLGILQYYQDYDETVPAGTDPYGMGCGWAGQIQPYIKNVGVFLCPSDTNPGDIISYALNANLVDRQSVNSVWTPVPAVVSQMTAPSKTVLLFEVINCPGNNASAAFQLSNPSSASVPQYDGATPSWWIASPAGFGIDYNATGQNLSGANATGLSDAASQRGTSLKYATGLFADASIQMGSDFNPADITPTNSTFNTGLGRHQNGANYILADGHTKFLMASCVSGGYDTKSFGLAQCPPWNNWGAAKTSCSVDASGKPFQYGATFAIH